VDHAGVDADAQIHPGHERRGVGQGHLGREVVDVRRQRFRAGTDELGMGGAIGGAAAEHQFAAAVLDQPAEQRPPAVDRPELERIGGADGEKHPGPSGRHPGEQPGDALCRFVADPVLVVPAVDRHPLGTQEVEVGLDLVPAEPPPHPPREQRAALAMKADSHRDAREAGEHCRRQRGLEEVAAGVPLRPQPGGLGHDPGPGGRESPPPAGRPLPRDEPVDVGAGGQQGPRPGRGADVDRGPRVRPAEVAEEGNRQQRVAEILRADHEDPFVGCGLGSGGAAAHRAKPTKKLNSCLLSYGA